MNLIRQIGWEKWIDPYGSDIKESSWPGAFGTFKTDKVLEKSKKLNNHINDDEAEEWDEDDYMEETDLGDAIINELPKQTKVLATPMGLIPITELSSPGTVFNFWTIHSNFRITRGIKKIINTTDGIESLDIFTPYRWRVSIGKAFDTLSVKNELMKNLGAKPLKIEN